VPRYAGPEATTHEHGKHVEEWLNELAADQAVFRITLQSFLLRVFATRPEAAERGLADLKDQVLRSIDRIPVAPIDPSGSVEWKRLTAFRAERLFGEIEDAIVTPRPQ
jgi:hypothetical protein